MDIEASQLWPDVQSVLTAGERPVFYTWEALFRSPLMKNDIPALKVISIDTVRDYAQSVAEIKIIKVMFLRGDYALQIYPAQDNLKVILTQLPLGEISGEAVGTTGITTTYRAVISGRNPAVASPQGQRYLNQEELNVTGFETVEFQLVVETVDTIRKYQVGGIFGDAKVEDVCNLFLTQESVETKVQDSIQMLGTNMVRPDQRKAFRQIVVPDTTRLIDIPFYLQYRYGIYNSGIGAFMQGRYWYVYPLFDTTRNNFAPKTLQIIILPRQKYPTLNRTYYREGSKTTVLVTGDTDLVDNSLQNQIQQGNGTIFQDSNSVINDSSVTKGGVVRATKPVREFVGLARNDKNNYTPLQDNPTGNIYTQYSELAKRNGGVFTLVWENSKPEEILPGMQVQIYYMRDLQLRKLNGIVLQAHHYVAMQDQGLTSVRYLQHTTLSIFAHPAQPEIAL